MKKEIIKPQMSGWVIFFSNIVLLLIAIVVFIYGIVLLKQQEGIGAIVVTLGIILLVTS